GPPPRPRAGGNQPVDARATHRRWMVPRASPGPRADRAGAVLGVRLRSQRHAPGGSTKVSEDGESRGTEPAGDHGPEGPDGAGPPPPPPPPASIPPPAPPPPPPPAPEETAPDSSPRRTSKMWVALVVAFLIGGAVGLLIGTSQSSDGSSSSDEVVAEGDASADDDDSAEPASAKVTTTEPATTTTEATTTTRPPYEPKPDDFEIEIVETSRKCFGTAGCSIEFEIDVDYVGDRMFEASSRYQVVYEIEGGDDLQIENFEVDGSGEASFYPG